MTEQTKPTVFDATSLCICVIETAVICVAYFLSVWLPYQQAKPWSEVFTIDIYNNEALQLTLFMVGFVVLPIVFVYFIIVQAVVKSWKRPFSTSAKHLIHYLNVCLWLFGTIVYSFINFDSPPSYGHEIIIAMFIFLPFGVPFTFGVGLILNWLVLRNFRLKS